MALTAPRYNANEVAETSYQGPTKISAPTLYERVGNLEVALSGLQDDLGIRAEASSIDFNALLADIRDLRDEITALQRQVFNA